MRSFNIIVFLYIDSVCSVICTAFIPITFLFYPETANRTLEDIDRYFDANREIIVCRNQLATQLSRPQIYIDEDERFAHAGEKNQEWVGQDEKNRQATVEHVA